MVPCGEVENPLLAMRGEVDPKTCDQLLKYVELNMCWPEICNVYCIKYMLARRQLKSWLQNTCWLKKFLAGALTGYFVAGQLLAYFKFLKIIFNEKRVKAA